MIVFVSRKSQEVLTRPLARLKDSDSLSGADGKPHISVGHFADLNEEYFPPSLGSWVINIQDVLIHRYHGDQSRLNGCCGMDGTDGFNLIDSEDNEIGTEKSDCWMPHCVIFHADLVEMKEVEQGSSANPLHASRSADS